MSSSRMRVPISCPWMHRSCIRSPLYATDRVNSPQKARAVRNRRQCGAGRQHQRHQAGYVVRGRSSRGPGGSARRTLPAGVWPQAGGRIKRGSARHAPRVGPCALGMDLCFGLGTVLLCTSLHRFHLARRSDKARKGTKEVISGRAQHAHGGTCRPGKAVSASAARTHAANAQRQRNDWQHAALRAQRGWPWNQVRWHRHRWTKARLRGCKPHADPDARGHFEACAQDG